MTNIYILRLLSGVELISEVSLENENNSLFDQTLYLKRPLKFGNMGKNKEGHPQIGFVGHVICDPECDELIMNGSALESYIKPSNVYEELKKEYTQTVSGIQLI